MGQVRIKKRKKVPGQAPIAKESGRSQTKPQQGHDIPGRHWSLEGTLDQEGLGNARPPGLVFPPNSNVFLEYCEADPAAPKQTLSKLFLEFLEVHAWGSTNS